MSAILEPESICKRCGTKFTVPGYYLGLKECAQCAAIDTSDRFYAEKVKAAVERLQANTDRPF